MRHASAGSRRFLRKTIFLPSSFSPGDTPSPRPCPSMEKGVEEVDEDFPPLFYLGSQVGYALERGVMSGFFWSFPFWFPLLFFCPFLSPLLLTNQAPMISIKGNTGTVFVLSLISENICCTSETLSLISSYL